MNFWRWLPPAAAVLVVPALLPAFYVTLFGYVGLATLVALGLVLLTGISGQTSFGQATFVGISAYATTLLTRYDHTPPILGLLAGLLLAGTIAWLLGLITARLSGHFLALVSVAWGLSFFSAFGTLPLLHGFNGIGDIPPLSLGSLSAANPRVNLGVIWAVAAIVMSLSANLLDSRMGRAIRTLNGARLMGESVGIDTVRLSRTVFVIAALYAGLAGFLFAHFQRFISPTPFSLGASIDYLFMVIIGGSEQLWGAPLGAALVVVLRDQFNDWIPRITGRAGDFEALVFSLVVILLLQRAPTGLLPLLTRMRAKGTGVGRSVSATESFEMSRPDQPGVHAGSAWQVHAGTAAPGTELLSLAAVSRNFGGLAAVRDVGFTVHSNEIVALIGPNGAGKTTLFNLISGVLAPSAEPHFALWRTGGKRFVAPGRRFGSRAYVSACEIVAITKRVGKHRPGLVFVRPGRGRAGNAAARSRRGSASVGKRKSPGNAAGVGRGVGKAGGGFAVGAAALMRWRSLARYACGRACCCWTNPPPVCNWQA